MKGVIPAVITHPLTLFRDGLRQILAGTQFAAVHLGSLFDDAALERVAALPICIWVLGVDDFDGAAEKQLRQARLKAPCLKVVVLAKHLSVDEILRALQCGASGYLDQDIDCDRLVKALELIAMGDTVLQGQALAGVHMHATVKSLIGACAIDRIDIPAYGAMRSERSSSHVAAESQATIAAVVSPALDCALHEPLPTGAGAIEVGEDLSQPAFEVVQNHRPDRAASADAAVLGQLSKREKAILRLLTEGSSNKVIAWRLVITEATVKVHIKGLLRKLRMHNRTQAAMWATKNLPREEAMSLNGDNGFNAAASLLPATCKKQVA